MVQDFPNSDIPPKFIEANQIVREWLEYLRPSNPRLEIGDKEVAQLCGVDHGRVRRFREMNRAKWGGGHAGPPKRRSPGN